jgi:hypothetical protein
MIDLIGVAKGFVNQACIQHRTRHIFDAGNGAGWRAAIEDAELVTLRHKR